MLTKNDIEAIKQVVKKEIQSEVDPLKKDMNLMKKDMNLVKKSIHRIDTNIEQLIKYEDGKHIYLRTRIERIEDHLDLPQIKQ